MAKIKKNFFRYKPFKGIISEIAREEGVTAGGIYHALYRDDNARVQQIALNKIAERKKINKEFKKEITAA